MTHLVHEAASATKIQTYLIRTRARTREREGEGRRRRAEANIYTEGGLALNIESYLVTYSSQYHTHSK